MPLKRKATLLYLIAVVSFITLSTVILPFFSSDLTKMYLLNALLVSLPSFFIPAVIYRRLNKFPAFRCPRFTHILLAIVIGIGCLELNQALYYLNDSIFFGLDVESAATTSESIMGMSTASMILSLAVIPPLSEEFLMRGALLESWRRYSPIGAAVLTSLLFALMHMAPSALIVYFGIGMLFAIVYLITRNVWLTVIVHFVNNYASVAAALSLKNGAEEAAQQSSAEITNTIEQLTSTRSGALTLFFIFSCVAAVFTVPALLALRASCKKRRLGMYSETEETVCDAEMPAVEAQDAGSPEVCALGEREEGSMWNEPLLWITIAILVVLNIFSGLIEFKVIKP